jgi:hypothetical protein
MALTRGDRRHRYQSAETMAGIVAEQLMDALEKGGFVIMRKLSFTAAMWPRAGRLTRGAADRRH